MIAVVQRVREASVRVDEREVAAIGPGLLALVGVLDGDAARDVQYLANRLTTLRIMADEADRMNRSVLDTGGEILLVSQFTLAGDTRKGRRPSFARAMAPSIAEPMLERLAERIRDAGVGVRTGIFGARMDVGLVNDGPVTLLLDSRETRRGGRRPASADEDTGKATESG